MQNEYWKRFEKTGFVSDYLDYVQTRENWQGGMDKEGVGKDESRNGNGDGIIFDAHRGIR